jgi:tetratricopeptide (TPR) repeat protein
MRSRLKIVRLITGGMVVGDKCPMCDSATTEVIDPDSGDLKVSCEACGYERIKITVSTYEDTISVWSRAIKQDPNNSLAYVNRATAHCQEQEYDKAAADFSTAIKLDPESANSPYYHYNRGAIWNLRDEYEKSIAEFSKAIELDPQFYDAYAWRGNNYHYVPDILDFEKALADYNKLVELDPDYTYSSEFADIYSKQGEYEKAINEYSKAIELTVSNFYCFGARGEIYFKLGEYENAVLDFTRAIELKPEWGCFLGNRGDAYFELGKYEKAITDFSHAMKKPWDIFNDSAAPRPLDYVKRGCAYHARGEFEMAVNDFSEAIKFNSEFSEAYLKRGDAYSKLGESELAKNDYQTAMRFENEPVNEDVVSPPEETVNSITFACSCCGKQYSVPSNLRGQQANCSCGNILEI